MNLKTKYQYTYFIYPYVIKENKYEKYLLKLLKDKHCEVRFFEREKDLDIYNYFLPTVRDFMFESFKYTKGKIRKFYDFDNNMQSVILSKLPCAVFEYDLGNDVQGKAGNENGIFFKIQKIEIICFNTGICFLNIKTNIEESSSFSDILNFNYKFRDINSDLKHLKEYENINIQTHTFNETKRLGEIIKSITGNSSDAEALDIDTNRFLTYSYVCIDQESWNEENEFEKIENEFLKYVNILPGTYSSNFDNEKYRTISKWKYVKLGFTKLGTTLFSSGMHTGNYTTLPHIYENQYIYAYIISLYQKIYLKKLSKEFAKKANALKTRKKFTNFTKQFWIQEITNDDTGSLIYQYWKEILELDLLYKEVKNQYDIAYKELNIEKNSKINKVILIALSISLVINVVNLLAWFYLR